MSSRTAAEKHELPNSLRVACESRHIETVEQWWRSLSDEGRAEFLSVAVLAPESLGNRVPLPDEETPEDSQDWYEYIVNHEVRFFFDRSDPRGNYNLVYPTIAPIDAAADAMVLTRLLSRPTT